MEYKSYVHMLTPTDRKRYQHLREGKRILGFVVQYETKIGDRRYPVVRYDTAHGVAHKDVLNHRGLREKVMLGETDYKEALNLADADIRENWTSYRAQFLRRMGK